MDNVIAQQPTQLPARTTPVTTATCISAISTAALSRRFAFFLEMSVCLAVYLSWGRTSREAKQDLYKIFDAAGIPCSDQYSEFYKTVNRRINAAAFLFDKLGIEVVRELAGGNSEMLMLNSVAKGLEQYGFTSLNGLLAFCGRPVALPKRPEAKIVVHTDEKGVTQMAITPAAKVETIHETPMAEVHTEMVEQKGPWHPELAPRPSWYPVWEDAPETQHINLDNVHIDISVDASRAELVAAAMRLLQMAEGMIDIAGEAIPAEPEETPEEAAEAIRHQAAEASRLEAEAIAAKKTPIAPSSRYRAKPPTKAK